MTNYLGSKPVIAEWLGDQLISPALYDTFSREVLDGWGTSDSGHTWVGAATGQIYVLDGLGYISTPTNTARSLRTALDHSDVDVSLRYQIAFLPSSQFLLTEVRLRNSSDNTNAFMAQIYNHATGNIQLGALRLVDGVQIWLSGTQEIPWDGEWINWRIQLHGYTIRQKLWPDAEPEPEAWTLESVDESESLASGTHILVATFVPSGTPPLEGPYVTLWDNLAIHHA